MKTAKITDFFGVKEGVEFMIEGNGGTYKIEGDVLYHKMRMGEGGWKKYNTVCDKKITIVPPKKVATEDEKVILRNLPEKYKWIARDDYKNKLCAYNTIPYKRDYAWNSTIDTTELTAFNHLFQYIKWEDDEPTLIEDLLKEG